MSRKIISIFMVFTLVFGLLLSQACTIQEKKGDKIEIVASFYPVYIFTLNLTHNIDKVVLNNMTDGRGGCLHDYQLSTKDMKLLSTADMLILNGAGMENFMEKAFEANKNLKIIYTSKSIEVIEQGSHDEHDEHEHDENDEHDGNNEHERHNHEILSHIWLSVPNAITQVNNIFKALVNIMPEEEEKLKENKEAYTKSLLELDEYLKEESKKLKSPVLTFHGAYEYFSKEYNIPILENIETAEGAEPSAQKLAELVELIKTNKVKAIFIEPEYEGTAANVLSSETGIKIYTLNPITSGDKSLDSYQKAMTSNMKTLLEAEEE